MSVRRLLVLVRLIIITERPQAANAHGAYGRSQPAAGAVIAELPAEMHVRFTQELFREEDANTLEVYDPAGTRIDNRDARIDDDDRTHVDPSAAQATATGAPTSTASPTASLSPTETSSSGAPAPRSGRLVCLGGLLAAFIMPMGAFAIQRRPRESE